MKNRIVKSLKWNVIDVVLVNIINIIVMVIIARILEPSDFGLMAMLVIFTAFSDVLVNSGFYQALVRKGKSLTTKECDTAFTANLIISVALYVIFFINADLISKYYNSPELELIVKIFFLTVVFNSLSIVPRALLSIDFDFSTQAKINILSTAISSFISVYLADNGYGYWALVSIVLTKSVILSMGYIFIGKYNPIISIDIKALKDLFSYGSKLLLAGIVNVITLNIHAVVIGKYFNSTTLGYYSQAYNFSNLLSKNILLITQKVSFPYFSSVEKEKLVSDYNKSLSLSIFITLPLLFGFASISREFVFVFLGEKWEPVVGLLVILSISRAITPISAFSINVVSALGYSNLVLKTDLLKLPLAIGMIICTAPFGIKIVALGQLILGIIYFIMNSYCSSRVLGSGSGIISQCKSSYGVIISAASMFMLNTRVRS